MSVESAYRPAPPSACRGRRGPRPGARRRPADRVHDGKAHPRPQIGMHPGGGHFTLRNRAAGREAASGLALFGDTITGERAAAIGMAWEALPDADVGPGPTNWRPRSPRIPLSPGASFARFVSRPLRAVCRGMRPWRSSERRMWSLRRKHGPASTSA
ncbi:hypothetical protein BN11_1500005 [Nostocoides australiense Ben110]|uniref:Uncharacterized protein n=1 Tax=Nostocoides australiense Ben110 TaxID=1193182 RepID=W6JTU7_9MICO|nr:hypothetical protein BN11_1500005 [Tetrasphaera australiensis Ben110]